MIRLSPEYAAAAAEIDRRRRLADQKAIVALMTRAEREILGLSPDPETERVLAAYERTFGGETWPDEGGDEQC